MAEVDDFFAKKDKRKKKKKFATTTTNSLAKALESQSQAQTSTSSEPDVKIDLPAAPTRDDEWVEEEEGEKDLEGLKVQALKIESEDSGTKQQTERERDGGEGEEGSFSTEASRSSSAWQNVQQETSDTTPEPEQPASDTTQHSATEPDRPSSGKYIPPAQRRAAGSVTSDRYVPPGSRRGVKAPPDIQSARAFPSLQASVELTQKDSRSKAARDTGDFKEVRSARGGGRVSDRYEERSSLKLTDNRFGSLEQEQNN